MMSFPMPLRNMMVSILLAGLCLTAGGQLAAEAKKKATGPDPGAQADAEVKKGIEPINAQLDKLIIKVQSRALLSPKEAGELAELKYKLMDIMNQYPQNALLARPVYQAGILFYERESYNDAYELFNYLAQGYPANPYGTKAKGQIQQLEKRFGADYFAVEASAAAGAAGSATPAPATKK